MRTYRARSCGRRVVAEGRAARGSDRGSRGRRGHPAALIGPTGTGKSHSLIALGHAAVLAGHRLRYLTAADLVETLYRGRADNTVGEAIETLPRHAATVVTNGQSYRMRGARQRRGGEPPTQ